MADATSHPYRDEAEDELVELVFVTNAGKTVQALAPSNLPRASMRAGGGIPFKCGGGICGACRCFIEEGKDNTSPVTKKERKHLIDAELAEGWRMACQTSFTGPMRIAWIPLDRRVKKLGSGGVAPRFGLVPGQDRGEGTHEARSQGLDLAGGEIGEGAGIAQLLLKDRPRAGGGVGGHGCSPFDLARRLSALFATAT